jgi:hypothetical protein
VLPSKDRFEQLVHECWSKTPFGHNQIDTTEVYDNGWIGYCMKKKNWNELDILNTHL